MYRYEDALTVAILLVVISFVILIATIRHILKSKRRPLIKSAEIEDVNIILAKKKFRNF